MCFQTLEQPTLRNVSATVKAGKLLAVIGPVGAGKVWAAHLVLHIK